MIHDMFHEYDDDWKVFMNLSRGLLYFAYFTFYILHWCISIELRAGGTICNSKYIVLSIWDLGKCYFCFLWLFYALHKSRQKLYVGVFYISYIYDLIAFSFLQLEHLKYLRHCHVKDVIIETKNNYGWFLFLCCIHLRCTTLSCIYIWSWSNHALCSKLVQLLLLS